MDYQQMDALFDHLWPITRSITGPGIIESFELLKKQIPLDIKKVKTGEIVFDWTVPPEWKLNSATLYTEDGEKIVSSDNNNLHVVNFSEPFSGIVDFEELDEHLYSDPTLPEAIPYVTSYYVRRWGFCLADKQRQMLKRDQKYRVEIDTEIYDGYLRYGETVIQGKSDETILLTSYLCHPSMANNELSGPLSLVALYKKLSKRQDLFYTYRFVIVPETIGSITFLATTPQAELAKVKAGIVLTCLGGPSSTVTFKHSRRHWLGDASSIDSLAEAFCQHDKRYYTHRPFTPKDGSDERQFCSPGINLPVIQAARTIYGDYDQYHTSLDDKNFMRISSVLDSVEKLYLFLRANEINRSPLISEVKGGEPMLGKRHLYPTINSAQTNRMSADNIVDSRTQLNLLLNVISLIDGSRTIQDIVTFLDDSFDAVVPTIELLIQKNLVRHIR